FFRVSFLFGRILICVSILLHYYLLFSSSTNLSLLHLRPQRYNLFHHNCNNFSNEVAMFLTGSEIPQEILSLPYEVLSTYVFRPIKAFPRMIVCYECESTCG